MNPLNRLTNTIKQRLTLTNTADTGLRRGAPSQTSKAAMSGENTVDKTLSDLIDRRRIKRTIENTREAMEIDPTVWSSVISTAITSNNWEGPDEGITADDDTNETAIEHIREKCKVGNWDLDAYMTETLIKGIVDSKCFIRTWPNQENPNTLDLAMLAYDAKQYNFIELVDPTTGELLGFKQKATIYEVPENWETQSFEGLAGRTGKDEETSFQPEEVIHPKYLERDGQADSLVFKALDYVDMKREIENMLPSMVRRATLTLGIQIGNADTALGINNETEAQAAVDNAATTFKEKEKKDVISYMFGMHPEMIGNGVIPDVVPIFDYLKQEIRQALLTPDSRFESQSSNRAVAQAQMGEMGQVPIMEYNQGWLRKYFEHQLINRELSQAGFESDIGKIHIRFPELEKEDQLQLSQIGQTLEAAYPSINEDERNIRINTYYGDYATAYDKQASDNPVPIVREPVNVQEPLSNSLGVIQTNLPWNEQVRKARILLRKEGVLY